MIVNDGGGKYKGATPTAMSGTKAKLAPLAKKANKKKKSSSSSSRSSSSGNSNTNSGRRRSKPSSSSSGSSSRRSSSSGSSNKRKSTKTSPAPATVAKPKPPPPPPSIEAYLGMDSAYQQALRGGKRSLNDFLSELGRRRGEAGTQFNQTKQSMERDRTQQLEDLRNEFASRGLIQSGLYGQEQGNFQKKFTEQTTALQQQQAALLADLMGQEKNYRREQELANEQAKQEALLRRSQKYKIGA